ncbi:hypothetical protein [Actinomadura viridis]|uniref:Uncharacterized protein n=1 Tax=Actinomadura viridis TaxID=58110 RepID=A0A931GLX9_9ACTN|nr:hypothetical protein [Actinomadura viridis]MBG6092027.1 hypothetical protein [Actinomadura viridis]
MTSHGYAEYVGGPFDGQRKAPEYDLPHNGFPPYILATQGLQSRTHGPVEGLRKGVYKREAHSEDDGPLWTYHWKGWMDEMPAEVVKRFLEGGGM